MDYPSRPRTIEESMCVFLFNTEKPRLTIRVRWHSGDIVGGEIVVRHRNKIFLKNKIPHGNDDAVYGYCHALVDIFSKLGCIIAMPKCLEMDPLSSVSTFNKTRED